MRVNGAALRRSALPAKAPDPLHFYFASDSHDGYPLLDTFISRANAAKPDFVLSGGDMTEEGTAREHVLMNAAIAKLKVPLVAIPGNHEYRGSEIGRYNKEFGQGPRSFDAKGVHFVTLDDANQILTEDVFKFLEKDLPANQGKPIVVAMHVPVVWKPTPSWIRALHKVFPSAIANYRVEDSSQAKRFTDLMSRNKVSLVLSGHTHVSGESVVGGVRYVTAGALGGKLGHVGTQHEFLDVAVKDAKLSVRHVGLDAPLKSVMDVVRSNVTYIGRQLLSMVTRQPSALPASATTGSSLLERAKMTLGMGLSRVAQAFKRLPMGDILHP